MEQWAYLPCKNEGIWAMKKRIWELDAARGICILGMVLVHILYDLNNMKLIALADSQLFAAVSEWGGVVFFLISGICVTLGSRPVRRGLLVIFCGMIVSAVTVGMYLLGMASYKLIIYFGVLHCLGVCMLLWKLLRKLPFWLLSLCAAALIVGGLLIPPHQGFDTGYWLMPIGFPPHGFATSDYFPLLPFLGFFLAGAVLGKLLYRRKESRFPKVRQENILVRFLCGIGRQSLVIYMLHQPVITGILLLLEVFR